MVEMDCDARTGLVGLVRQSVYGFAKNDVAYLRCRSVRYRMISAGTVVTYNSWMLATDDSTGLGRRRDSRRLSTYYGPGRMPNEVNQNRRK